MIKHVLATLRKPIYRRISPVLIVVVLSMAVDGVFWYLGVDGPVPEQTAFILLATGWAVAVMALALGLFIAAKSDERNTRKAQQTAYEDFVSQSDNLVAALAQVTEAESARDAALSELDTANKNASRNPDEKNLNARLVAYAKFEQARGVCEALTATTQNLLTDYGAAETAVALVVAPSVRPAFDEFRNCPPENTTARASARSRFVQDAGIDRGVLIGPAS
jgi:hypothetical protein